MDRNEAINLIVQGELASMPASDRISAIETAIGEGLLDEQPHLAELVDNPRHEAFDAIVLETLRRSYVGTTNQYILERLRLLLPLEVAVTGLPELLHPCPCCSYLTLPQRGQYDICPVCNWEDSGISDPNAMSGPNHGTLNEARARFALKEMASAMPCAYPKYLRA